jgi:hypothetical protein
MMKIYSLQHREDFRMYLQPFANPILSASTCYDVDEYPEIGRVLVMGDEPHLYISEPLKEFFEENFSDSGYFVGDVVEVYPKPVEGKVIRGYYKWMLKHKMVFQREEDITLEPLPSDICYVSYSYNLPPKYLPRTTAISSGCRFSERAVNKILAEEVYNISF